MSQFPAAAAAPGIRLSQLSQSGIGDVADSLNLFRGDVNLPLPVVSLRGRNGLDAGLTAFYASNVDAAVQPSNLVAPTGILGVGWSLPRDQIVQENRFSGATDDAVYLVTGGSPRRLVRSGHGDESAFELADYQFWTVTHHRDEFHPEEDWWEVIREDGSRYVYGRSGIEWGVRWGNWSGPGTAPGGRRFPVAWNLVQVTSPEGDTITFDYEREEVPIGQGPAYTRACYLTRITGTFGERVTLGYRPKEPFEVAPPHPVQAGGVHAFQDRYESRYLDDVTVANDDGATLFTIRFGYRFGELARTDGESYRKRYLTSITEVGRTGIAVPPVTIEYCSERDDANPGAIRALTYPKGARVGYEYAVQPLRNAAASLPVPPPGRGYVPRVWHGPGYVIVTWHSTMADQVHVQAYTWNGTWNGWSEIRSWAVAEDSLYVQTAPGFYAAGYMDARTGEHRVRLYRQDPYKNGEWHHSPHQVNLPAGETPPLVRLGRDFAAIADHGTGRLLIVSWDPVSGGWTEQQFGLFGADHVSLAATADACVAGCYDAAAKTLRLALHHRDAQQRWVRSDVLDERAEIDWRLTVPGSVLGAGDTFAAASFVSGVDEVTAEVRYGMRLVTWDAGYRFGPVVRTDDRQPLGLANPIGATGISGSVVGNAQHLFRFDGRRWQTAPLVEPVVGRSYGYAYGADVAVAVIRSDQGTVSYRRGSFDPYSGQWLPAADLPVSGAEQEAASASVSGDVLIAGYEVLRRSPTLSWEPLFTLPRTADPDTIANRAPAYIAWQDRTEPGTAKATKLVVFDADGLPQPVHVLDGESFHVTEPRLGQLLAGAEACVTYRGPSFDAATGLRLHRILNAGVDTDLVDRAVHRAVVDDGYKAAPVTVRYDTDTATYDPYGLVAQYVRARLYRGEEADAPGYVESVFFNGLRPDVPGVVYPHDSEFTNARQFFAKLNGQLYTQTAVDVHGRRVSRARYDLYTYDSDNSDYVCRGSFTRRRRTEASESSHLLDADPGFVSALDARTVPQELRDQLADAGFPLTGAVAVTVERAGTLWTITDESGLELTAVLDDGRLGIYGWLVEISESDYNARGQLSRELTRNVDSSGEASGRLVLTTFGWEAYPQLAARHMYDLAAEMRTIDTRTAAVIDRSVCTYSENWPSAPGLWSWNKTYRWDGEPGIGDFDFARWSGTQEPERGWVRTNRVLDITGNGLPRATTDIGGNQGGVIYDRTGRFPVAVCALADPTADEAAWYGFEEYEEGGGWQLTPAGTDPDGYITTGDAFTGRRRLAIPGDPANRIGLRRTFDPADAGQPFLLSCWIKTDPGFVPDPELAGWVVTIDGAAPIITAIPDTGGRWRFFHQVVDGVMPGEQITVEVFSRQDNRMLLVDAISFAPLHGRCTATVYDPVDRLPEATLDQTGTVTRYGYDRERRPVLTVRDGQPTDSGAEYDWRAYRPDSGFDPADPNAVLGLIARTTGSYTYFRHGDEWTRVWDASAGWQARDGELSFDGASGLGTLSLRDAAGRADYATRVALASVPAATATLGLAFGAEFRAEWAGGRWQLHDGEGTVIEETSGAPVFGWHDLTLCVTGASMLLAADGQIALRHRFAAPLTGAVQLRTDGPLSLSWIAVCGGPVVRLTYLDNAGQARQAQSVSDGELLVSAWAYDRQGRADIATKTALVIGAPGFRPGFIAPLHSRTGRMGDCELVRAYPQDDGYPFSRVRFEPSPLGRAVEQGAPGPELAINPSVGWADRHTTRMLSGLNLADSVLGLPAGQYRGTGVLDPDGELATQLTDRFGAVVATRAGRGDAQVRSQMRYDARGNVAEIRQPNYFDPLLPDHHRHVTTMEHDPSGNLIRMRTSDMTGPVVSVYDRAGRSRFRLMPQQAADGKLSYFRYDRLGRLIEQGICDAPWDEQDLHAHADDLDWLPGVPHWRLRYLFDGPFDGPPWDLGLLGRLWRTEAAGEAGEVTSTTFGYDRAGRVNASTLAVPGSPEHTVRYRHDLTGAVTALEYDDGVRVDYGFDGFNRVTGVAVTGQDGGRREVAAYTYLPDGSIGTETLRPGADELVRGYSYSSAGWLREIADRHLVESTDYFIGGYDGGGSYTGRAARVSSCFTGVDDPAFLSRHHYEYGYDALGRLLAARAVPEAEHGEPGSGDGSRLSYDLNGNLLTLTDDGLERRYLYYPGGNRLRRLEMGGDGAGDLLGSVAGDYVFNADGDLTAQPAGEASAFRYDPVTGRPVRVETRHETAYGYSYDAAGARVLKSGPDGSRLYLPGADGAPLLTQMQGQPRDHLIYGPGGLIAVYRDGDLLHLLKGRLGSTRAIWDGTRLVGAFNYRPFGDLMTPAYRLPPAVGLPYLFTGAELDAETGMYNLGARFYDPVTGRMISFDPAGQYPSPYLYAGADPVNMFDPSGEFSWSWGAFAAVTGGLLAIAGGVALTVLTAGAATPILALGIFAGGALIGAGVASAAYGFTHADADTSRVDWMEWGINVGLGAGFGGLAAGLGIGIGLLPVAAKLGTLGMLGVETVIGGVLGMGDSLANTVLMNALAGHEWLSGWQTALWTGAAAGAIGGAIGGALSRGAAMHTSFTLREGKGSGYGLYVAEREYEKLGHTVVGGNRGVSGKGLGTDEFVSHVTLTGQATAPYAADFNHMNDVLRAADFEVPAPNVTAAYNHFTSRMNQLNEPPYRLLVNDCTTWAKEVLRAGGIHPPFWAFTPRGLSWWATLVGERI